MKRRTFLAGGVSAMAVAALAAPALADTLDTIRGRKKLMIALDLGSPPFGMTDGEMRPTGSDVETAQLLADSWGMPMDIVQVTSPNRVPFLLTGKADMVIASFSVNEERLKVIDFSDPYGVIQAVVAGPKGQAVADYAALAGKRIGTTRGSTNDKEVTARAQGAQIMRFDDDATLTTAMISGQVDLVATSPQIVNTANGRKPPVPFETKIVMRTFPYAIGIRKGDDKLKAALNDWVHENLKNGKLNAIYKKYHGADLPADMLT
ncbi:transporter substrate-binding domain-containing protein [Bradyrhizobium sp. WD16]|uniref:transporter substrate-binding domain-containing protein n=1 Tax=Bradyrhizobium sp. WD16 TaxID=1521768 RepID=UPI0020A3B0DB|nr:transporter substrate-binding domain-containing protein [Bradyrhizobium sp. WD16]UTD26879.1 amino acid ABC transporter [Bradyrhizobium sp. WD16]